MNAVWAKVRSDLRSSLGGSIALVLVIGLAGGLALGAAGAARRTQTAFDRFRAATLASDLLVSPSGHGLGPNGFDERVARLPGVDRSGLIAGILLAGPVRPGQQPPDPSASVNASVDGKAFYSIDRPHLLAGRLPSPNQPNEMLVDPLEARVLHATVGSRVPMATITSLPKGFPNAQLEPSNFTFLTMTVTGIGVAPSQVLPASFLDAQPAIALTPAFYRTYTLPLGSLATGYDGLVVRLRPGTDRAAMRRQIDALATSMRVGPAFVDDAALHVAQVRRSLLPQVVALWIFAGLAVAGLVLVVGLSLARRMFGRALEHPILRTLGMTRGQLAAGSLVEVALLAMVGAVVAVAVAASTSSMAPFGSARAAEPNPGFAPNWAILGPGFVVLVLLILAVTVIPAWRAASVRAGATGLGGLAGADRPSRLAERAGQGALPATAAVGIRMALEPGRGRTAVPVRSGTIGLAVALAALTAAFTFGTNLTRLVSTPSLFGWNWDAMVGSPFGFSSPPVAFLHDVPGVAAVSAGNLGHVTIGTTTIPAVGIDPGGGVGPTMVRGRPPRSDAEIALGSKDLRALHRDIGETITVRIGDQSRPMRIVGQPVFPAFAQGSFEPTGLGEGALVAAESLASSAFASTGGRYNFALVRFAAGSDAQEVRSAIMAAARAEPGCHPADADPPCLLIAPLRPGDIASYTAIRGTPFALAGVLSVLGLALMTYTLLTSVRRRRRDLAVLKTLGFLRRQVSATVAWQATILAAVAGVIGLPLGIMAGRWAWIVFAGQLGVPPSPAVPVALTLLAIPGGLLLANLIAWAPGRIAARTPAAVVLRSE